MKQDKHIHFIGICGVAMSALALAFHKNGWKVSGSDKGFYPPVSTKLKESDVHFYPGWHPEKMTKRGKPDLVVIGNVVGSNNPEWKYTQEHDIDYCSYPELISEYLICENSIVCVGSYGKTTTTTLLSWILKENEKKPSYLFGGIAQNKSLPAAEINPNSDWSIVEGDEYKTSRWDKKPKFKYYNPTHLLLTSVVWDHTEIFSTPQQYQETFVSLVESVPKQGLKILSEQAYQKLKNKLNEKPITYGQSEYNEFRYTDFNQSKDGIAFTIYKNDQQFKIRNQNLIGEYMAENITGAFALAKKIGIETQNIIPAIESFQGIKRRLERRKTGKIEVYDDIAHSPEKAKSVLSTLNEIYDGKIIAVFEPNTGNRKEKSAPNYKNAFRNADEVVIPRLSKVKKKEDDPNPPVNGPRLKEIIETTHNNANYIEDDFKLVDHLVQYSSPGDVIVFLGSHGFRKMIEMTIDAL